MRVLVTGAGSGIGRAACMRLARDGKAQGTPAKIACVDVASSPGLDGVVKELIALGAEAIALHGDMATADAPGKVVFLIVYGISGNTHRFWSLASARRKIGYTPEDDSQVNFADRIAELARAAKK